MAKTKFEKVRDWYVAGLWNKEMVYNVVGRWITPEEYEIITGEPYVPDNE